MWMYFSPLYSELLVVSVSGVAEQVEFTEDRYYSWMHGKARILSKYLVDVLSRVLFRDRRRPGQNKENPDFADAIVEMTRQDESSVRLLDS
jgi:hypothetical protein